MMDMQEAFEQYITNDGQWPQAAQKTNDGLHYRVMHASASWTVWQEACKWQCEQNKQQQERNALQRDKLLAALKGVAESLERAGAKVPSPENKGTIESSIIAGLSIALCLVERAIEETEPTK